VRVCCVCADRPLSLCTQSAVEISLGVPSSPLQQAEAVTTSIKVTCVALAAKVTTTLDPAPSSMRAHT
jgi:hypothetical protein